MVKVLHDDTTALKKTADLALCSQSALATCLKETRGWAGRLRRARVAVTNLRELVSVPAVTSQRGQTEFPSRLETHEDESESCSVGVASFQSPAWREAGQVA